MQRNQVSLGLQHPQHPGFVAADAPYSCRACINWHCTRFGFPELDDSNEEAWRLYFTLQSQVRIGMDVVGLDYAVLPVVFDLLDVPREERRELFERLVIMDREASDHRTREAEQERLKRDMEQKAAKNFVGVG